MKESRKTEPPTLEEIERMHKVARSMALKTPSAETLVKMGMSEKLAADFVLVGGFLQIVASTDLAKAMLKDRRKTSRKKRKAKSVKAAATKQPS